MIVVGIFVDYLINVGFVLWCYGFEKCVIFGGVF